MRLIAPLLISLSCLGQETTWREVAPLLDRHCNSCHRAGQVGPFDFTSYEGAAAYAPEIARYIMGDKMPPWRAKASPIPFSNSRALPEGVTAKLLHWTNTGTRPGTPPAMPRRNPQWNLGAPDLVLAQPTEHTVSAEKTVDIVRFEIGSAELGTQEGARYFDAFEVRPSNRNLLHHAILKIGDQPIAAWAMCDNGIRLPKGIGWRLPQGKALSVELHYFKRNLRAARDLTRIALYFAKQQPQRNASLLEITKLDIRIPAGANLHSEKTSYLIPADLQVHAILPVFQLLAAQVRLRQKGIRDYFLWIDPFEHHLMTSYQFAVPLRLKQGSAIEAEAIYDNSTQNQYNPHQKLREIRFAENGLDETFRIWLTVSQ
jgi:hypothetical protein